ncbi:SH3 domain protein [Pseudohyphozyma bogoriensis]|nr:SH3 domain protein [Pseudohyphozyma bogoriensis]
MYSSAGVGQGVGTAPRPGVIGAGGGRGPALTVDVHSANNRAHSGSRGPTQVHQYSEADAEAHDLMHEDDALSDEEGAHHHEGEGGQHEYDHEHEHEHGHEHDEEGDDIDDSGSFSDSLSSSPSIPDEDIDFALVYALHTFLATVDGQASVVKGDKLLLLDDTNSYWWLVRVLKTQAVGYIPAENIETPFERLARLNKHRNVDLTTVIPADYISGPSSTIAQTRFDSRIPPSQQPHPHLSQHPSAKGVLASPSHKDHPRNISPTHDRPERAGSSKAKTVLFTAPIYYEHSANGESDGEYEEGDEYDEEMMMEEGEEGELRGDQVFDDDEGDEESDFSEEEHEEGTEVIHHQGNAHQAEVHMGLHGVEEPQSLDDDEWVDEATDDAHRKEMEREELRRQVAQEEEQRRIERLQQHEQQAAQNAYQPPLQPIQEPMRRATEQTDMDRRPSESGSMRSMSDSDFDPDAPTKKLTATPPIIRDPTFDIENPYADQPGGLPRPSSPVRVRGVDLIDPKDPRYGKLISERRPGDHLVDRRPSGADQGAYEADTSINSLETGSSLMTSSLRSDDGQHSTLNFSIGSQKGPQKLRKGSRDSSVESGSITDQEKKRKSGGILGLFRKKDKKKKDDPSEAQRSSEESVRYEPATRRPDSFLSGGSSPRSSAERTGPGGAKRESQTGESMFSMDATLRQQELEAKQAMYHQYGIHRGPGDLTNTMTPRNASMSGQSLSPTMGFSPPALEAGRKMRPGSLIGSPSIPGLDVPVLSVLRIFAGDNIEAEATFKTVLLNNTIVATELVKQAMQRFELIGSEERDEYYLTIKEFGGEARPLADDEKPLVSFESLVEQVGGFAIPSVKRSSVGSINSISSNLSLNPAITRLDMNDFSDDSAVKLYLNRRLPDEPPMNATSDTDSVSTAMGLTPDLASASAPSFRFAVRILIHPEDLPENIVFDPHSSAIIPKAVLIEREQRNGVEQEPFSPHVREKIIFFPRNVNVSEVIEASVDRFGIVDAVVDGGDEVEDRLSRRRSTSRVKYGLAMVKEGQEAFLHSSGKLVDAYSTPPLFKQYDRTSKEFRRRSVDATLILGGQSDIQPTDPVFIIRRAPVRHRLSLQQGLDSPTITEESVTPPAARRDRSSKQLTRHSAASSIDGDSIYGTPTDEKTQELLARAASPQATRQDIQAAQRAISKANQRSILSAQQNSEQGVDIVVPEQGTIRSSRKGTANDEVRYSYIDEDGTETDISDIVEKEWGDKGKSRSTSRASKMTSATEESYQSAAETLGSVTPTGDRQRNSVTDEEDEEEREAISALQRTFVTIDKARSASPAATGLRGQTSSSSLGSKHGAGAGEGDVLQDALLSRRAASPLFNESLQDRLDRVLAKVKEDKANGRGPGSRRGSSTPSGRGSPAGGTTSPFTRSPGGGSQGRRSPLGHNAGRDSPSIDQIISQPRGTAGGISGVHGKKASIASIASALSSGTTNTDQPSTPITAGSMSNGQSFTPISSVNSGHRAPVAYHDDFGLDTLIAIVEAESRLPPTTGTSTRAPLREAQAVEGMFGRSLGELNVHPQVQGWFEPHTKTLNDLDSRLDALLAALQA